jgi:probable HAF family extracellular repeat protein
MRINIQSRLGAWSFILLFALASTLRAQSYTLIDIGALPGGNTVVTKINLAGQAVGQSGKMYGVQTHAFAFTPGNLLDLGTLSGGEYSSASDVNTRGAVVGESNTATNIHAFIWDKAGGMQDLGTLPGDNGSRAFGINDSDQVVGYSSGALVSAAFIWTKKAGMTSLGTLPGGDASEAFDINNAGSVVGVSSIKSAEKHAFLWTSGKGMQDLGTLPGDTNSQAYRINNPGSVIGSSMGPDVTHAFLWTPSGGMQNLGTLGGDSTALDLNNNGDVVGTSTAALGGHAFHWTSSTGMQDLNTLIPADSGVILTAAIGINNAGWIVAIGAVTPDHSQPLNLDDTHIHAGPIHAFLLTPVH